MSALLGASKSARFGKGEIGDIELSRQTGEMRGTLSLSQLGNSPDREFLLSGKPVTDRVVHDLTAHLQRNEAATAPVYEFTARPVSVGNSPAVPLLKVLMTEYGNIAGTNFADHFENVSVGKTPPHAPSPTVTLAPVNLEPSFTARVLNEIVTAAQTLFNRDLPQHPQSHGFRHIVLKTEPTPPTEEALQSPPAPVQETSGAV